MRLSRNKHYYHCSQSSVYCVMAIVNEDGQPDSTGCHRTKINKPCHLVLLMAISSESSCCEQEVESWYWISICLITRGAELPLEKFHLHFQSIKWQIKQKPYLGNTGNSLTPLTSIRLTPHLVFSNDELKLVRSVIFHLAVSKLFGTPPTWGVFVTGNQVALTQCFPRVWF